MVAWCQIKPQRRVHTTDDPLEYEVRAVPQAYLTRHRRWDGNSGATFPVTQPDLTVIAVAPHMYSIGTHIRLDMVRGWV